MVGVLVIADVDELVDLFEVDFAGLVVVYIVEVFHGHEGENDHAEGEGVGGPPALIVVIGNL
jgi:hypothetical protein